MKNNHRTRRTLSIVFNLLMFATAAWSVGSMILYRGSGNMQVAGTRVFMYFTVDSNLLCALACLITAVVLISGKELSPGLLLFKYVGTTAVTVTLMTVLFFLGPTVGYLPMFSGVNLFLHLLSPLAAILSLSFWDGGSLIPKNRIWLSVLPTFLYGIIYLYEAVFVGAENGGWHDFYGFNMGGFWYVSYVVMLLATALFGILLWLLHNRSAAD